MTKVTPAQMGVRDDGPRTGLIRSSHGPPSPLPEAEFRMTNSSDGVTTGRVVRLFIE